VLLAVLGGLFVGSAGLTWTVRGLARRWAVYDRPVDRSLHTEPTPRLGGTAIAVTTCLGWGWLLLTGQATGAVLLPLLAGGAVAAVVGLVDDASELSPWLKLSGQSVAVGVACLWLANGTPWVVLSVWALVLLTHMNFFNFMDGSDGLAGGLAVLASGGLALLAWDIGATAPASIALVLTAAAGGFLTLNHPPASIFMGDTGSQFLGFALGFIALHLTLSELGLLPPLMVLGPFIFDATVTLGRRALAGERVWRAHRTHLYQRLIGHGYSHLRVAWIYYGWTLLVTGLAWVVPRTSPPLVAVLVAVSVAPGFGLMALIGALDRGPGPARQDDRSRDDTTSDGGEV
jgi:UDP-N-acetylmuramyl pentapeptide phosphotransferase/UDP-N-acetylglucosamine-1-phosphate transferase